MIAPPDVNGKAVASPAERATVAELWVNRRWRSTPGLDGRHPTGWAAPGVPPADGDAGRTAVVQASRDLADKLTPLLRENGVPPTWPLVIWQSKDGTLEAAAGDSPKTWTYMRKDLGAHSPASLVQPPSTPSTPRVLRRRQRRGQSRPLGVLGVLGGRFKLG